MEEFVASLWLAPREDEGDLERAALLDSLRARLRQGTRVEVDTEILDNYICERCAQ